MLAIPAHILRPGFDLDKFLKADRWYRKVSRILDIIRSVLVIITAVLFLVYISL